MADVEWANSVRTLEEARNFVLARGICGVLHNPKGKPNLWDAIDAPDKQAGEAGWGDKMGLVWSWKNDLPARYPTEIFYGKRKGGGAILCSMDALRGLYREQYKLLDALSETARRLRAIIAQHPVNNKELRQIADMAGKDRKPAFDRALVELQVAFHIVRVNRTDVDGDTWTLFATQYPDFTP